MTTKLIAIPKVPKQDVQQKDVPKQAVPKQDIHKQAVPKLDQDGHQQVDPAEYLAVFPEYPPRDDMNNPIYLHEPSHMRSLAIHFGRDETTFVMSEVPVSTSARIQREHRRPDLMVAFDCDRDLLIRQKGYATMTQGKPPDLVLEVASESTGSVDYTDKRAEYAGYGIPEYWRFDPSGGNYHDAALAGDRLVGGEYERIEIEPLDGLNCRGYSAVLGLWLYWEDHQLRWLDPETGRYLRTHDEEYDRAEFEAFARRQAELHVVREEHDRRQAETRAEQEAQARHEAELRASYEAYIRRQAENRASQAENRASQAENRAAAEAQTRQQAQALADAAETRATQAQARAEAAEAQAAAETQARQQAQAELQRLQAQLDALSHPNNHD